MTNPPSIAVHRTARTVGRLLADMWGADPSGEIELALAESDGARPRDQYIDPVSVGALVVSVAQLGWMIYIELRDKSKALSSDELAQELRNTPELRTQATTSHGGQIIDATAAEIVKTSETDPDC